MPVNPQTLGEFEQMVLLAVLRTDRAGGQAYGVTVHAELEQRTRRRVARGSIYMTLDRLERKGLLSSFATDPMPERGGRSRRCYKATKAATAALRASRQALLNLWQGLRLNEE